MILEQEPGPDPLRRLLLMLAAGAPLLPAGAAWGAEAPRGDPADFDFLVGRWRAQHCYSFGTEQRELSGESVTRKLLGGQANYDEHTWGSSGRPQDHRAITLRVFDPALRRWSVFWLDGGQPVTFSPPAVGGFSGNEGVFLGQRWVNGRARPLRLRCLCEHPRLLLWEQASADQGQTDWRLEWRTRLDKIE